jgi:hypothetical protein
VPGWQSATTRVRFSGRHFTLVFSVTSSRGAA